MKVCFLMPMLCLVAACSDELGGKDGDGHATMQLQEVKAEAISYEVIPLSEPNAYSISFSWPTNSVAFRIVSRTARAFINQPQDGRYVEAVVGGESYTYQFEDMNGGSLRRFDISVPKDFVLKGNVDLKGDTYYTANRIFVESDAVVSSYQFRFDILANEIIARGGLIQNFPVGTERCRNHSEAFDGGNINIIAKKASGVLNLSLSGAQGCGNSKPGGAGGKLKIVAQNATDFSPNISLLRAKGSPERDLFYAGPEGAQGTTCVLLNGEEGRSCD